MEVFMSKNEKDLKAELMELINGEHKNTENRAHVAFIIDGKLEYLLHCDSFVFDSLCKDGTSPQLFFYRDYDLFALKTDIDYQIIKALEEDGILE